MYGSVQILRGADQPCYVWASRKKHNEGRGSMGETLTKLIYSSNHGGLSSGALDSILHSSRSNNDREDITGVLVVGEEDFLQILEGERSAVAECFMRIMQDDRHKDIRIMLAGKKSSRSFSKWSMHCVKTSGAKRAIISRYYIDEVFDPSRMSQDALEELFQTLAACK
ncbi:BLUF domain-containing protein [Paracoccus liaowanqingii]|uniref:BLUF domain-containing protein n=1 Tax=Paracoccus liaowanqingii TaxID=2560053 RepID=A0A4Z1CDP1_9RHOB|nr:BLUF domain-containing protein [Paracoccus liaowanqingii]